jgi:hypothetical protein
MGGSSKAAFKPGSKKEHLMKAFLFFARKI